jgi:hypothetical protein
VVVDDRDVPRSGRGQQGRRLVEQVPVGRVRGEQVLGLHVGMPPKRVERELLHHAAPPIGR